LWLIRSVFKYARQQRGIEIENPVSGMKLPKGSASRNRRLRQHEAGYLYKALEAINPLHRHLAEFAVETAMRQGELLALTWEHIVTTSRRVTLEKDKSGNEIVGFPISTRAAAILAILRPSGDDHEICMIPVFKISQDRVSRAFRKACKAGREAYEKNTGKPAPQFLADLRFHDLRHEATSCLFEKGMNRAQVKKITRHKTSAMLDRYTHLDHSETSDIARLLG
jgi:integrase